MENSARRSQWPRAGTSFPEGIPTRPLAPRPLPAARRGPGAPAAPCPRLLPRERPAGRHVSARRKALNFLPRAPRERKSRAAPGPPAAAIPHPAVGAPSSPSPSVRPGALGKALPTGAWLLIFASFSIAGSKQRAKAARGCLALHRGCDEKQ